MRGAQGAALNFLAVIYLEKRILTGDDRSNSEASVQDRRPGFFYGYYIVIASLFIYIMMWGSRLSFGVFIGPLLDEFHWSRASTSAGFSATWILTGLLSIFVGRLNDRFGPRIIMTVAGGFLALGYFLISTIHNEWQLYAYFLIVNIGMSAALVPTMSTVARWFVKRRALMSGIVLAGTGIALMVISPLANALILSFGWRTSYVIVSVSVLVIILLSAQFLKRDPYTIGRLPYGYSEAKNNTLDSISVGISAREALSTNQLWIMAAIYACLYFTYNVVLTHMVLYAGGQGISPIMAVTVISVLGISGIAGRVLMGFFADRFGNRQAMLFGVVLMIISFVWLLFSKQLWMLYVFGAIYGFGHGGLAPMESTMAASIFGLRAHGAILGIVFAGDTVGGTVGPFIAGYIYDVTRSYALAFGICAALAVIILILILLLRPVKQLRESLTLQVPGARRPLG